MVKNNGYTLARENRVMIEDIKADIKDIKINMINIANHYSNRVQPWVTALISTLLCIIGVIGGVLSSSLI